MSFAASPAEPKVALSEVFIRKTGRGIFCRGFEVSAVETMLRYPLTFTGSRGYPDNNYLYGYRTGGLS